LEKEDITDFIGALQEEDARAWPEKILNSLPQANMVRVVVTTWAIWYARRRAIHEDIYQSPLSTHAFIDRFIADLGLVSAAAQIREGHQVRSTTMWSPPPQGVVKINVDAAVSKNSGRVAIAAIARGLDDIFIGASAIVSYGITDPETLEAMACREGVDLASDLLIQRVRVASDCFNAIRGIHEGTMGIYSHIVQEIKAREGDFHGMEFVHKRRKANQDAHGLACGSLFDTFGRHVWLMSLPRAFVILQKFRVCQSLKKKYFSV
jgi:ribonuclease HI